MRKTYEYNPEGGTYYEIEDHPDGGVIVRTMQDVSPILEQTKKVRNSGLNDGGIKKGWWKYATIPSAVWLKWKHEDGIDIFNKDHEKAVMKKINSEYPYLKNTERHHQ